MPDIVIEGFVGTAPRQSTRLLPPNGAQYADDSRLFNKEIRSYKGLLFTATPFNGVNTQTIYRYVNAGIGYWFDWATPVKVARVPITGDALNRIYYTGDGVPKKTGNDIGIPLVGPGPANWYNMGVKNPAAAPTQSNAGGGSGAVEAAAWVITYVTGWGEESGPSPAVVTTSSYHSGDSVTITRAADTPDPKYNITAWRVYRTITNSSGVASFFFVGQQNTFATTTFVDTVTDVVLVTNGGFPSSNQTNFAEPPSDLAGLTGMPNGMLAGFSPSLKQVCFSEPYFPYAWPVNYRRGLQYDPIASGASGNMYVVATNGKPAIFIGNDPSSLSGDTLDALQSCSIVSGLAESPFGVVWPSPDGLYMVGSDGTRQIITRELYDKATWQTVQPAGMAAAIYDGRYYGIAPGLSRILVLDPNEPDDALTFLNLNAQCIFSDFNADGLYLVVNGVIYKWDGDGTSYRQYRWKSKVFTSPRPNNYGWVRLLFNFPTIAGQTYSSFATYAAARNAAIALNTYTDKGSASPSFGADYFGSREFGGKPYIDPPADVGSFVTVNVYGDGVLVATRQVTNQDPVRLPAGFECIEWEVEVLAKVNVQQIFLAETMDSFQQVQAAAA